MNGNGIQGMPRAYVKEEEEEDRAQLINNLKIHCLHVVPMTWASCSARRHVLVGEYRQTRDSYNRAERERERERVGAALN